MKHKIPNVKFRVRELGEWVTKTSDDYFKGKRVVVFGLPGAFTPTCSSKQLPGCLLYTSELPTIAEV